MFRTPLELKPNASKITLKHSIITIGSCFSDAIGQRLAHYKFKTLSNPFGTVYNPISIHRLFNVALSTQSLPFHSYTQRDDVHSNYYFHSSFSSLEKKTLENMIQTSIEQVRAFLQQTDIFIITYGTAWVYEHIETGDIVTNCQKQPAAYFSKRLLSQQEIIHSFSNMLSQLKSICPEARIIFTLSPVRHVKDTLELNMVSKAILRSAIHEITQKFTNTDYFPAYEIMMDDLRDYRFYKADMLHPTMEAENYIWEKFVACYFDTSTQEFIKRWSEITTAIAHNPFHAKSNAYQTFLKSILVKLQELSKSVNVEQELTIIESKLINKL